jgi:hypothetical protein
MRHELPERLVPRGNVGCDALIGLTLPVSGEPKASPFDRLVSRLTEKCENL